MKFRRQINRTSAAASPRKGVAAVEFAMVAPLFMTLILGIAEMGRAIDVTTNISAAIREGGRLASMNLADSIPAGMTANEKVTQDIQNMLTAGGIPGDNVEIEITYAEGAKKGDPFDLSLSSNYLELFQITARIPYTDVSFFPLQSMYDQDLTASLVFRMGRSSLAN